MSDGVDAAGEADTLVIPLDPPITVKGGEWAQITLVEPRAQQVRLAEKELDERLSEASHTAYQMELVRAVAGVPKAVVEALRVRQLGEAYNFLAGFMDDPYEDIDQANEAPPDTLDLPIEPPLTWNKGSYPSLPLREPTAEELRKARGFMRSGVTPYTHRSYQMELLQMVTGFNPAIIHGLRIRTLTEASRHLALFIAAGRRAGKASRSS